MTDWVRLWHDMPSDPKWRTIARKSGQRVGDVIAIFAFMMTNASANASERGRTHNLFADDIGTALDLEIDAVEAVLVAMRGKVWDDAGRLTGWGKRQPKREDSKSAERARAWRERNRTQPNATERIETPIDIETETESEIDKKGARTAKSGTRLPDDFSMPVEWTTWASAQTGWSSSAVKRESDTFIDYWHSAAGAKGRKQDWHATWRNWVRRSNRPKPGVVEDDDDEMSRAY